MFSLKRLVSDINTYIASQHLDSPIIIGHSMGGLTAFSLASQHKGSVSKVISIDGLPFIGPIFTRSNDTKVAQLAGQAKSIQAMYNNMSSAQLASQTQQGVFIQATSQEDQARVINMASKSDPSTVANAMYDVMTTDLREDLNQITIPMLMLGASGAFSQDSQHEQAQALYEAQFNNVKNAKVVMNTQVRHFMMFDDVDWVYQQIIKFLGE
jgi:pimeloyl-ACP methyl ester carboxylesterase